jgi:hypothetical protein
MNKFFLCFYLIFPFMGLEAQELGSFDFALKNNAKIEVFYSLPKTINSDTRLVMVMHGRKRNGEEYRDQWVKKANELNLAIIVPQFPEEKFPGVFGFNYGNVFNESLEPTNNSIYDDLDSLVDSAISKFNLQSSTWGIYGHGAGAHFVHRLVLHNPEINYKLAIAANPGWYLTLSDIKWPFGLKNSGISDDDLKKALSKYFLVMLGKSDTSTKPNTPYVASIFDKVTAQGQHRLDRGRNFFKGSIKKAKELDVFLKWGMVEVPTKDGHSNTQQMVPYAAELFYERLR